MMDNTKTVFAEQADRAIGVAAKNARYTYDRDLLPQGWEQYDTEQDAWYFGIWVDVKTRRIFTFAEGDRSLATFATQKAFVAELRRMGVVYGNAPPALIGLDTEAGTITEYRTPRPGSGLLAAI